MAVRRTVVRGFAALLLLLLVLLAAGVGRLAWGPVPLVRLIPAIEERLSDSAAGIAVTIGRLDVVWPSWREAPAVRAAAVRITGSDGRERLTLPAADLGLSVPALLEGRLALGSARIHGARVALRRGSDGQIALTAGGAAPADAPSPAALLAAANSGGSPLSFLQTLRLAGATVEVMDPGGGKALAVLLLDATVERADRGLTAHFDAGLVAGGASARAAGTLTCSDGGEIAVSATLSGVQPPALAAIDAHLQPLAAVDVPVAGGVSASFGADGRVTGLDFALTGGAGSLAIPGIEGAGLPVRSARLDGDWAAADATLRVDDAEIVLDHGGADGARVTLSGTAVDRGGRAHVDAAVAVSGLAVADLVTYWPSDVAANARQWVAGNLTAGTIDRLDGAASLSLPLDDAAAAELTTLHGRFSYGGLAVHYLRPLPPITGLAGTAELSPTRLTFAASGGESGSLKVDDVNVVVSGLDTDDHRAQVAARLHGPVRAALALLGRPRLDLLAGTGVDPERSGGSLDGRLRVALPLLADLAFKDVGLSFRGKTRDARLSGVLPGLDLTGGQLDLEVTSAGFRARGPLTVNGAAGRIDLSHASGGRADVRTRIKASVTGLSGEARAALGVDLRPYLSGPADVSMEVTERRDGIGAVTIAANLAAASLALPAADWSKKPGAPGSADAILSIRDRRVQSVPKLTVDVAGLSGEAALVLGADGTVSRADISRFSLDRTALRHVVIERAGGGVTVRIGGGVVDARPLLAGQRGAPAKDAAGPPLTVDAPHLDRVRVDDAVTVRNAAVHLERGAQGWRLVRFAGDLHGGAGEPRAGTVDVTIGPPAVDGFALRVRADPWGEVMAALDASHGVTGGRFAFDGTTASIDPTVAGRGHAELDGVTVGSGTVTKRALDAAASESDDATLQADTTTFDHVEADLAWQDDVLTVEQGQASAPAMGVYLAGTVNIKSGRVDMHGNVVPLRRVDRALGRVPVLGRLLNAGRELLAIDITVQGPLANPQIETHVLKSMTPEIIQRLGDFLTGGGAAH